MNRINFKVENFKPFNQSKPKVKKIKTVVQQDCNYDWPIMETKTVEQPGIKHETIELKVDKKWNDFGYDEFYDRLLMYGTGIREQIKEHKEYKTIDLPIEKKIVEKPKIEIKEEDIIVRDISNDSRKYTEFGHSYWHNHSEFSLLTDQGTASIKISDNVGGCGVQQLYNWVNSANNNNIEFLLKKIINSLKYGVGLVMCQVGQDYFNTLFVKGLTNCGFTYISYINYEHGKSYEARMYMLKIEK